MDALKVARREASRKFPLLHEIVKEHREYPMADNREETMFLDTNGDMICVGDVVMAPVEVNQETHGTWGHYKIRKAPGGYVMAYLRSEKGQVLPEGYTGGYMSEVIPKEDEVDLKTLVFTLKPIKVKSWEIVND